LDHLPRLPRIVWFAVLALATACTPVGRNPPSQAYPAAPSLLPVATSTTSLPAPPAAVPEVHMAGEPPVWLSDPAVNVLTVAIGQEPLCRAEQDIQVSFVNAETGERFDLDASPARAMLWLDANGLGLLSLDGESILSIDFSDGSVATSSFDSEGIRLLKGTERILPHELGCTMTPLSLLPSPSSQDDRIALVSPRQSYSADLSLFAGVGETAFDAVEVHQVGTGELVWSADPEDEYDDSFEAEFAWSPAESSHLAVVECGVGTFDACQRRRLYVVDVARGEQLASYPGEFMNITWSPDGSRILYQHPEWEQQGAPMSSGPPCMLDLTTNENQCFQEVAATHFPDRLSLGPLKEIVDLQWNQRGDGFFYTYRGILYDSIGQGTPRPPLSLAGLCHFELSTHDIDCLSGEAPELQGAWIGQREFSADERFAYVQAPGEGNAHGVLNLRTRDFSALPVPPSLDGRDDFDAVSVLWRPSSPETRGAVHTTRPTEQNVRDIPSIWAIYGLTEGLDLPGPGTRRFSVDVNRNDSFIWPFYWCASDEETLTGNLRSITVDFLIDDLSAPPINILEFDQFSREWDCHFWATMLSGWEHGTEISLVIRYTFREDVHDGVQEYPAGDYSFELNVKVGR